MTGWPIGRPRPGRQSHAGQSHADMQITVKLGSLIKTVLAELLTSSAALALGLYWMRGLLQSPHPTETGHLAGH